MAFASPRLVQGLPNRPRCGALTIDRAQRDPDHPLCGDESEPARSLVSYRRQSDQCLPCAASAPADAAGDAGGAGVYLAGHGQTDGNLNRIAQGWTDTPLNDTGRLHSALLAERLRGVPLDGILASMRCRSGTAEARVMNPSQACSFLAAEEHLARQVVAPTPLAFDELNSPCMTH